jgi:hypothetical protein
MNRRHMLGTLGALAASAGCRNAFQRTASPEGAAATANAVKLRLCFAGLCAFMSNNNFYDVGLIDPTGVKDPANENFHEHIPQILIDSTVSSGGTLIKDKPLADLRLTTDLDSFRMWSLKGYDVEIAGLPTKIKTQSALTGAFPLRAVYPNGSIMTDWQTKGQFVHSVIPVKGGQLESAVPRVTGNGAEKSRWKLTAKAAPDEDTWNKIQDLPRLMSDVVEYRTRVPENTIIKLILRADRTKFIEIDTTAKSELEVWVVNQPADKDHTTYEGTHAWELQHVSAFYQLFNAPPSLLAVPTTNPATYPTSDPIFCPPAEG